MSLELVLILALILANGVFSMAEIAIVSSRKARLQQLAESGNRKAKTALELAENPDDFLSTVQVGITLIGTLAGAFGGATVAERITPWIASWPQLAPYASTISMGLVVTVITYLSLIIGELAPKRIGLGRPEAIASAMGPPMRKLSRIARPIVSFLSFSTDMVMAILPFKKAAEAPVTEEEIKVLIQQGTEAGSFHEAEQELVTGVFRLGDRRVSELMTPRHRVVWVDQSIKPDELRKRFAVVAHTCLPIAEGSLDRVTGVVYLKDFIREWSGDQPFYLEEILREPLFVPETVSALQALELFEKSRTHFGIVVNEHGGVEGIVTVADLLGVIVGEAAGTRSSSDRRFLQREDGSWLVDGAVLLSELREHVPVGDLPGEDEGVFTTLGGFVMMTLTEIPRPGDSVNAGHWRFEVTEMDGNRVDQVSIAGPGHGLPALEEEPDSV